MKLVQKIRHMLAEQGLEKTIDETKSLMRHIKTLVKKITYDNYIKFLNFTDDDIREMARKNNKPFKEFKGIVAVIVTVGEMKYEKGDQQQWED